MYTSGVWRTPKAQKSEEKNIKIGGGKTSFEMKKVLKTREFPIFCKKHL